MFLIIFLSVSYVFMCLIDLLAIYIFNMMNLFLCSWNSYSVSWLVCWGRETPTKLAMRNWSALIRVLWTTPLSHAPAAHLLLPPTTSSEFNPQGSMVRLYQCVTHMLVLLCDKKWRRNLSRQFLEINKYENWRRTV